MVKTDGLAAGKGVIVCATLEEADAALALCLEERAFGAAGATVVVEEFMTGEEVSFFALADGVAVAAARRAPRTTRRSSTATAGPTPAAWAPTRRRPSFDAERRRSA